MQRTGTSVHVTNYFAYSCYFMYKTNTECCLENNNLEDYFVAEGKWMNVRVGVSFSF